MAKTNSYYDWELKFRKKSQSNLSSNDEMMPAEEKSTKLGISELKFKKFLEDWKKKNL